MDRRKRPPRSDDMITLAKVALPRERIKFWKQLLTLVGIFAAFLLFLAAVDAVQVGICYHNHDTWTLRECLAGHR